MNGLGRLEPARYGGVLDTGEMQTVVVCGEPGVGHTAGIVRLLAGPLFGAARALLRDSDGGSY